MSVGYSEAGQCHAHMHTAGQPTLPPARACTTHSLSAGPPHLASASSARMHSLSASRLLLISAPSSRVCLSLSYVSVQGGGWAGAGGKQVTGDTESAAGQTGQLPRHAAQHQCARQGAARNQRVLPAAPPTPAPAPRSLPARSMNDSLPTVLAGSVSVRSAKHRMECELQHGGGQGRPGQLHRKRMCNRAPRPAPHCFAGAGSSPRRLVVGAGAAGAARSRGVVAELLQHVQATDAHLAQPHHLQQGVSTRAQPEHWRRR